MNPTPVIEVENLTKRYPGGVTALDIELAKAMNAIAKQLGVA